MKKSEESNARTEWVEASKGFVIVLMVLGHSGIPEGLSRWIWSFHMPFFFIISALFTSWSRDGWGAFALRKGRVLLVPFVVYSAVNLALYPLAKGVEFKAMLGQTAVNGWGGVALWFVPVFYLALLACKAVPRRWLLAGAVAGVALGAMLDTLHIFLPRTLASVPYAAGLMMATRAVQPQLRSALAAAGPRALWVVAAVGLVVSVGISHYWRLDMAVNRVTPVVPLLVGIAGGTAFAMAAFAALSPRNLIGRAFAAAGRNTYEIMALSQVTIALINKYMDVNAGVKYALLVVAMAACIRLRHIVEGRWARIQPI